MEKGSLIGYRISHDAQESTLSSKIFLSQLLPNKHFDYNRNRLSILVQKLNSPKSLDSSFVTFKCQQNKSLKNEDKENCNRLPAIHSRKQNTLVEKCFSRNDIVKDRSEMLDQTFSHYLNTYICVNQLGQNTKSKNVEPRAVFMQKVRKSKTKHTYSKEAFGQKSAIFQRPNNLEQQMKEWALIKKKNEYNAFKLMRKNNYQRMKSNMIIAEAMKQLMDKREQLLGKEENQTFVPPNESNLAELQK